ncbi:hypothetical protein cyc_01565 [Cyclospora cayetanensis]|uniref:Uncharacterized protein n=1 Tax=Cyclospora cayetanensis TaxID=88456 RepID=A0A1D3CT95_9EIME|nr:hypothetical protein cyc_01565 [Cyclospora cayetanensis]
MSEVTQNAPSDKTKIEIGIAEAQETRAGALAHRPGEIDAAALLTARGTTAVPVVNGKGKACAASASPNSLTIEETKSTAVATTEATLTAQATTPVMSEEDNGSPELVAKI